MQKSSYNPHLPPILSKLKRGPQVTLPKDIGLILGYTGIGKNSKCLDAGAGSGFLSIALGNVAKSVVSYEIREDFLKLAQQNIDKAGLKNITLVQKDIFQGMDETGLDLITLDLADSDKAVASAYSALSPNGFLIGYLPHAEQVQKFASECKKAGFKEIFTLEGMIREYLVREQGFRPENTGLTHTAYLVFAKK